MRTSNPQRRMAAALRIVLLSLALAGVQAIHAQALPLLNALPVSVIGGNIVGAGNGQQFTLSALTADRGFVNLGSEPTDLNLRSVTSPGRIHNESRFVLFVLAKDQAKTFMQVTLTATTRRCLLSTIDPVLNEANEAGRVIEVSSSLIKAPPSLSKPGNPVTLCTMDSGKLSLYFSAPALDMVQLTAVSYGSPSNVLRSMSTQSAMLYFPLTKF